MRNVLWKNRLEKLVFLRKYTKKHCSEAWSRARLTPEEKEYVEREVRNSNIFKNIYKLKHTSQTPKLIFNYTKVAVLHYGSKCH